MQRVNNAVARWRPDGEEGPGASGKSELPQLTVDEVDGPNLPVATASRVEGEALAVGREARPAVFRRVIGQLEAFARAVTANQEEVFLLFADRAVSEPLPVGRKIQIGGPARASRDGRGRPDNYAALRIEGDPAQIFARVRLRVGQPPPVARQRGVLAVDRRRGYAFGLAQRLSRAFVQRDVPQVHAAGALADEIE